jgi:hypothetical protein
MPIIWDHQCYSRLGGGQRLVTQRDGGRSKESMGVSWPEDTGNVSQSTSQPSRIRPRLLDNGQGEKDKINASVSTQTMPFAALPVPKEHRNLCHRDITAGTTTYHRSLAAGTTPPPPSTTDTSTDDGASQVTLFANRLAHHACPDRSVSLTAFSPLLCVSW